MGETVSEKSIDALGRHRYCVLHIRDADQDKLKDIIEKHIPSGRGGAFIPRMELYRRGEKTVKEVPMFPGYVFIHTDLDMKEIHGMLTSCRTELNAAFRELALKEWQMADPDFLYKEGGELCSLSDLDDEETEFLDLLWQGGGLLAMSCGYEENKHYHVVEGPLKAYEDKIWKVDKHNRKAFLRFEINGRQARAGFECRPRAHWYPEEDTKIATLSDGTEVDLEELKKKVMAI
ncbi:MAG: hypothetical protein NC180_10900 [Muribaculaceae bacterium]|nr:hypothetical protein [Roseburia sp.]MCM1432027.1 hypothetical protein [Muribaculaceae bacterium]MCM1493720.1 hypothetical protein [Muribaculaceae bacterium]